MGRKLTQEEVNNRLFSKFNGEYSLIDEYIHSQKKMKFRHNICGQVFENTYASLMSGKTSCPCLFHTIDLIGQKFGLLTVLNRDETDHRKWICKCDCGNIKSISAGNLQTGHTKSCGCNTVNVLSQARKIDKIGKRYGKLVIQKVIGVHFLSNGHPTDICECLCDCGNIVTVFFNQLTSKVKKSCGCLRGQSTKVDLTGRKYGNLTVISENPIRLIHNCGTSSIMWNCICDCGNYTTVSGRNLTTGKTFSCGCLSSKTENTISDILKKYHVNFKRQYRLKDCIDKKSLPFDFGILKNKKLVALIEYDGEGHYKGIQRRKKDTDSDIIARLDIIHKHDEIKSNYCLSHNIPLLRIPYWDKENLSKILLTFLEEINYFDAA